MTRRRLPDWFPAILGVVVGGAIMFGFMFHVLDTHDTASRDRDRDLRAEINQNKEALARANADRVVRGLPAIIVTPSTGSSGPSSTTTRPTSPPPTAAPTTTTSSTVAPRPPCLVVPTSIPILGSIPGIACSR